MREKLHLEDKFLDYVREDLPDEYDEALENNYRI